MKIIAGIECQEHLNDTHTIDSSTPMGQQVYVGFPFVFCNITNLLFRASAETMSQNALTSPWLFSLPHECSHISSYSAIPISDVGIMFRLEEFSSLEGEGHSVIQAGIRSSANNFLHRNAEVSYSVCRYNSRVMPFSKLFLRIISVASDKQVRGQLVFNILLIRSFPLKP